MFLWIDYLIFILVLIFSVSTGIYFGCFGSRQNTTREYLFGGKSLHPLPVGISVSISYFSSVTFVSFPADVYKYGINLMWACLAVIFVVLILNYVFLPIFFHLQVTSVLDYYKQRFDGKTRSWALILAIIRANLYLPIIIYSPSLCLASATGINVHLISFVVCGACVFYTTIGGLKAVIWTDIFQFLVVAVCLLTIFVTGIQTENLTSVWNKASAGNRTNIFDFDIDPTRRDSFWIIIFGYSFQMLYSMGLKETGLTKFLSLSNYKDVSKAIFYAALSQIFITIMVVIIGVQIYAKFAGCDPLQSNQIEKHDQLFPFYVTNSLGHVYGVSGLFLTAVFCASLSSISSVLNSLCCIVYNEFVIKFLPLDTTEKSRSNILKIIVLMQGIFSIGLAILAGYFDEILPISYASTGLTTGPLLGLIVLGVFFPRVNSSGAFYGSIGGFIAAASIVIPARYYQLIGLFRYPSGSLSTEDCNIEAFNSSLPVETEARSPMIFNMSFHYYTLVGMIPTIILGLIFSNCSANKHSGVDEKLLSPLTRKGHKKHLNSEETMQMLQ